MGWLSSLVGGGVVEPIAAIGSVLDNLITTDEERAAADLLKNKLAQQPAMAQHSVSLPRSLRTQKVHPGGSVDAAG